jgi:hypothetical protein
MLWKRLWTSIPKTQLPHAASEPWPLAQSLSDPSPLWHKHQVNTFLKGGLIIRGTPSCLIQTHPTCSPDQLPLACSLNWPPFACSLDSPPVHLHCQCAPAHPPPAYMSCPTIGFPGLPSKPSDLLLFILYHFIPYLLSPLYSHASIFRSH